MIDDLCEMQMQAGGVVRMGPCGGGGGNDRKIGMVGEVTRIVQVAVRHCALLLRHGLATVTINDNPKIGFDLMLPPTPIRSAVLLAMLIDDCMFLV